MVQYKQFNIYDPLDREAALWLLAALDQAPETIPTDEREVRDLKFEIGSLHRRENGNNGQD